MIPSSYVLSALSDGCFHSGEELGALLGVSRAAVWKQLQQLEKYGLQIESVRGRGYRIVGGLDLLDKRIITEEVSASTRQQLTALHVLDCVDSTNTYVMSCSGEAGVLACLAEYQSTGRGRRGRAWVSPYAANLYLSVRRRFESGVTAIEGLSLAVGVVLARMLHRFGYDQVKLKWPNDLLANDAKLGGILIEINGDPSGAVDVVVGVGLNVRLPRSCADSIDQAWTDLATLNPHHAPSRNVLAAAMLDALVELLWGYEAAGFTRYRDIWNGMDACAGRHVVLRFGNEAQKGIAKGVDAQGALLIETDAGVKSFSGGEISMRIGE